MSGAVEEGEEAGGRVGSAESEEGPALIGCCPSALPVGDCAAAAASSASVIAHGSERSEQKRSSMPSTPTSARSETEMVRRLDSITPQCEAQGCFTVLSETSENRHAGREPKPSSLTAYAGRGSHSVAHRHRCIDGRRPPLRQRAALLLTAGGRQQLQRLQAARCIACVTSSHSSSGSAALRTLHALTDQRSASVLCPSPQS